MKSVVQQEPASGDWVFDLKPGIDLLEVVRVLGVVQGQALQLLQQQLHAVDNADSTKPAIVPAERAAG